MKWEERQIHLQEGGKKWHLPQKPLFGLKIFLTLKNETHIAKAKIRSLYDKGIKMIFAKILYPDFFAAAVVFHLVKLSIC